MYDVLIIKFLDYPNTTLNTEEEWYSVDQFSYLVDCDPNVIARSVENLLWLGAPHIVESNKYKYPSYMLDIRGWFLRVHSMEHSEKRDHELDSFIRVNRENHKVLCPFFWKMYLLYLVTQGYMLHPKQNALRAFYVESGWSGLTSYKANK